MCSFEQKEKIKKLALQGLKPADIKKKMPELEWDNKQISDYLRKYTNVADIKPKIAEKTEEKLIEKIAEKQATAFAKYTIDDSFEKFKQIQALALTPQGEYGRLDLTAALKAEENAAKLKGLYEMDNKQKNAGESLKVIIQDV
jgi:hypothetical protein